MIDCSLMEGKINSERGSITIHPEGRTATSIPVADVAVLLIGMKVHFSAAVMHRLLQNDVAVIACDWKGVPEGAAYPWKEHSRVGARHRAQASLTQPRRKNAWGRIIKAKVKGQQAVLSYHSKPHSASLRKLATRVRSGDPDNIEAQAARIYWQALWGEEEFTRLPGRRSQGSHQRNSHLDYAYTVLRGHGIRATLSAGLAPSIGLFHRSRSNYFNLVDDLIEPFRPAIDLEVSRLPFDADMKDPSTRQYLVAASTQQFMESGESVSSAIEEFAVAFAQYTEGNTSVLHIPTWYVISEGKNVGG